MGADTIPDIWGRLKPVPGRRDEITGVPLYARWKQAVTALQEPRLPFQMGQSIRLEFNKIERLRMSCSHILADERKKVFPESDRQSKTEFRDGKPFF